MENHIDRVALNARMTSGGQNQNPSSSSETKMVALASGTTIRLWAITDDGQRNDVGNALSSCSADLTLNCFHHMLPFYVRNLQHARFRGILILYR